MKVLQIYTYYPPENVASTHLKKDLTEAYVNAGFELCVVAPIPTRGVDEAVYQEYKEKFEECLYDGQVKVHRFSISRENKRFVSRAFRYLLVNVKQYRKAIKMEDIDVISSGSTPPTQGLVCARVKKKMGVPFVYNLQDIFPDSLVNARITKKGSVIWKIGRKIEDRVYKAADKIIVISEDHKKNIMNKGVPEGKIVVVPNWVNTDNVYPVKRDNNPLFDRFGLDKDLFYITYCGNLGLSQNFSYLFDVADRIKKLLPDVHFVLIGEGAEKENIEKAVSGRGLSNIHMFPFQPYEDISYVFSLGDVGMIISKAGVANSSVPSKTWSIMAAEKPLLASFDKNSNLGQLIESVSCGLVSEPDDADEFISNIQRLYEDETLRNNMGKKGKRYLTENLDKEKCVSKYVDTLKSVVI